MQVTKQVVINREYEVAVMEAALKRYAADLQITIDRFPELMRGTFESHLDTVNRLAERFRRLQESEGWVASPDEVL